MELHALSLYFLDSPLQHFLGFTELPRILHRSVRGVVVGQIRQAETLELLLDAATLPIYPIEIHELHLEVFLSIGRPILRCYFVHRLKPRVR